MRKRYLVSVSGLTKEDEKNFIDFLRSKGILWWHWINDFWMLVEKEGEDSKTQIRDFLRALESSRRGLVIEIEGEARWAGFGPKLPEKDMFKWLRSTWNGSTSNED
jgi:hypothetical protein